MKLSINYTISNEVPPERQITMGKVIAFDPGVKTLLTGFDLPSHGRSRGFETLRAHHKK